MWAFLERFFFISYIHVSVEQSPNKKIESKGQKEVKFVLYKFLSIFILTKELECNHDLRLYNMYEKRGRMSLGETFIGAVNLCYRGNCIKLNCSKLSI